MSPAKKKPGLTVAIGIGKPKGDLSGPGPLEKPPGGAAPKPKPYGGGAPKPPTPPPSEDPADEMGEGAADESGESPQDEQNEEYGEKLISDMSAPLAAAGVAPEHVKPVLSALFRAIADCIDKEDQGGDQGPEGADMGGAPPMAGGGAGGAGGY